ncbi:isoleucine-tRNA ligase [Pseudocyphellaria aurata]|nr:isoleucine-tRNA ligase [Pseudocyphellaria aurata]
MLKSTTRTLPKSWSSTLSLPKSTFPPRALPADRSRYLQRCADDLYAWQKSARSQDQDGGFTLQDGPPYANGDLHIGHALNKILKDIACRFQLSQGKRIDFVPGWDCHGLPIELKALQQQRDLGVIGLDERPGPILVRNAASELAIQAVERQKKSFREWGIMADWENAWKTMDKDFELDQLEVFMKLVKKGLIHRRFKPVYWSPSSRTALAEAELEYNDNHQSTAAFVKYPLDTLPPGLAQSLSLGERKLHAVIWTTTPWTLPANKAIGIHSDMEYVIVASANHGLLLLAKSRLTEVQTACREHMETLYYIHGSELVGATYQEFSFNESSPPRPLLHASFVSAETGSGLVHLAPGHGIDDYEFCLKHNIPAFAPLDDEGRFTSLASPDRPGLLTGKEVLTSGNMAVLDHMNERGCLLGRHKYRHKYPYDWRSTKPVILRATEQWFADVQKIREDAMRSLDTVTFIPESGKARLKSFIENRSEWCISRQRAWGLPIPALYHKETREAILTEASVSHIISTIKDRGIDAWWTDHDQEPSWTPSWLRNDTGQTSYRRGKDTMDVWFDSGTSWTQTRSQNKYKKGHVADVYLEGTDQHRGWFQSSLLTHIAQQSDAAPQNVLPEAPFRTLITHGFTLDEKGRKMSKSIGNVVTPETIMQGTLLPPLKRKHRTKDAGSRDSDGDIFDSMGPDALRLWVASCDFTKDVAVSQTILKGINSSLSKYRVTFKLLLGILEDFVPSTDMPFLQLDLNHRIALMQLQDADVSVRRHFENFEFIKAVNEINKYINIDFSALYMESIKDAVYAGGQRNSAFTNREMAQYTLLRILTSLQRMLSPVTPLLVEETWDYTPKQIREWQKYPFHRLWTDRIGLTNGLHDSRQIDQLENDLPHLLQANSAVKRAQERARMEKKMGSSLQSFVMLHFPEITRDVESKDLELFNRYRDDLETLFVVSKTEISAGPLPSVILTAEWCYKAEFDIGGSKITAYVYSPQQAKCVRCWKYTAPVEAGEQVPLCHRCELVVEGLRGQNPGLFEAASEGGVVLANP